MNHYEKDEFFNGATGQRGNGATGRCKFCLLGVSLAILFTIFSCQKEEQLLLEESAASENPIAARSTGLMSDSIWAKPSVDQLNALWGAMMAEATVDDIGGFLYQHGLFEWSLAKVVKEFDTGSYVLSVPTVMEGDVASILFVYVENSNYAYWHIPLSELENDTQVLLDRYGASNLIVAIFSFLQYGQVWGDSEHGFLYGHLAHPSLAEQFLEIVPRGWCLIEIELYTENQSLDDLPDLCNCVYKNLLAPNSEPILNPPPGFNPAVDDPDWIGGTLGQHLGQDHMWRIYYFDNDGSIIHGTPGEYGTTVYHFWAWCPDEFDQTPWGFNFTSNFDPRGGDGNGPAPPVWDYGNPRWDEDTRGCMVAFNDPKATEKINQLEEALLTQSCGDAAEFIVKNIIDNIVIGLCNEFYDGLDEGTSFPNGTAHDMNETLEEITTTVESHNYYQISLDICEVCDNAPSPLQVSQCYQAVNSCGTGGYEECVEDALNLMKIKFWVAESGVSITPAQFDWLLENPQIFEEIFKKLEDQEIIEEIFDLLLKHNLHLPCNPEVTSEAIIASVIDNENFKSNPRVETFYQTLAEEEDYIIEDASFENCSYAQCIYGKILGSNNPVNCALIDPLFNDDDFGLALHLSDKQYSYTTFDNESNMANMFIRLKCNGNNENDLEVAATIVHEMIHAEIMMTLFGLGLDPNNLQSFDEAWDNYQLDYMLNLQDMYDLNDIHHAVMVFVEGDNDVPGGGAVDRIAKILWELNGRQLTIEHYYHIAWGGLRYIDSQWAEDEYGTNSAYYTLHQELLISNPNLSLGC